MKFKSILYALCYFIGAFFLLPYVFSSLTRYLHFPIFQNSALRIIGIVFVLAGIIDALYCYILFFQKGKGTPIPTQPAKKLIVEGLYRYTRNPIYLGHFLIIFGEFLLFGHSLLLLYFILFFINFHFYITLIEEKELKKRFGKEYIDYTKSVPRYMPKIK